MGLVDQAIGQSARKEFHGGSAAVFQFIVRARGAVRKQATDFH
jgi:hypothetical protein